MGRITEDRIDRGAQEMLQQMRRNDPPPPARSEIEAPSVNNANQPSYYGKGTLPVVSTASGGRHTRGEWSWTLKYVRAADLADYGLAPPIPAEAYLEESDKVNLCQRGDWDHWEYAVGQWLTGPPKAGFPAPRLHHTNPIVLTHLDPHPILCESYAQAEAECARVGKEIQR